VLSVMLFATGRRRTGAMWVCENIFGCVLHEVNHLSQYRE
jgi:hypothetical protein